MAFNGAGVFNRLYNWVADRNAGTKILASRMDAEMDGFATGLSNCIAKDGQTTITAPIPFNGQRITNVGNATAATDAMNRQAADTRYLLATGETRAFGTNGTISTTGNTSIGGALGVTGNTLADGGLRIGAGGTIMVRVLSGALSIDFGNTTAQSYSEYSPVSIIGAQVGDLVLCDTQTPLAAGLILTGKVTSANTVTVRLNNYSSSAWDLNAVLVRVMVVGF